MVNKNYLKGRRKEQYIVAKAKAKGYIAIRSAQSRSPIDVIIIDPQGRKIKFVQSKPQSYSVLETQRLMDQYFYLNGTYEAEFSVE